MATDTRKIGCLAVKPEYLLPFDPVEDDISNDDRDKNKKRKRGQHTNRKHTIVRESVLLCPAYAKGISCSFGEKCKFSHSVKDYLEQKESDIADVCPVFEAIGFCKDGWRCRWLSGHVQKAEDGDEGAVDGWKLVLDAEKAAPIPHEELNGTNGDDLKAIRKEEISLPLSQLYMKYLEEQEKQQSKGLRDGNFQSTHKENNVKVEQQSDIQSIPTVVKEEELSHQLHDHRSTFPDTPIRPTEKRKIKWSGLQVLAPLTTLGNPPFRRLTRSFGAQLTYSEMSLTQPLLAGQKSEWALIRAHPTELSSHAGPPNSHYGVQIAGSRPAQVLKTTELLVKLCSGLDTVDLNCGCPLDMVFKQGAGSALLDSQAKLVKIVGGMVAVSGDVPVSCKIRMGISQGKNTAQKLLKRLIVENVGVSAVTLHGRSRAQRYSKAADWEYIAECAALIKRAKEDMAVVTDSSYQNLEYGTTQQMAFIGNGDVNSYIDFYNAMEKSGADTSMIARGAIIKPWIFEEITQRQHLDKSASERLEMLKQYTHWGLEHWGSDAHGVSNTRRFFCEFMSFFHRYVPLGILEHSAIPPHLHDRPPKWCGRSDLETLLGSADSRDWVKVSEMFLGKVEEGWHFTPKHKSNSVDAEG